MVGWCDDEMLPAAPPVTWNCGPPPSQPRPVSLPLSLAGAERRCSAGRGRLEGDLGEASSAVWRPVGTGSVGGAMGLGRGADGTP